ncbi:hypothetical protein ACHAWF_017529 [Thalassiosira exigua]
MVHTVKSADTSSGQRFVSAVESILKLDEDESSKRVAFDCEGVYLVDFGGRACPRIVSSVKALFESHGVTKIIHDCKKDCDALHHHHGITLNNVHDTSCFHDAITRTGDKSLNDVLRFNGIRINSTRDNSVYKYNPRFWSARPLTEKMIDWASSDVDKLFALADEQHKGATSSQRRVALDKSAKNTCILRDMHVRSGLKVDSPGLFIGSGGRNVKSLEKRTGTFIYKESSQNGSWYVYYDNAASLSTVKRSMSI